MGEGFRPTGSLHDDMGNLESGLTRICDEIMDMVPNGIKASAEKDAAHSPGRKRP